jgi:vacuolar-type H+-ATPase subunit I/STV1
MLDETTGGDENAEEQGYETQETNEAQEINDNAATPDWFMKDKYKSIEDQAEAAYHLQKKLGGYFGPPKETYNIAEELKGSLSESIIKEMEQSFKEVGLSDKGFSKIVEGYDSAIQKITEKQQQEILNQLTKEQTMNVQAVEKWLNESFERDDAETIKSWIDSVESFNILNKMRVSMPSKQNIPMGHNMNNFETTRDVEKEKMENYEKYTKDNDYRRELTQRFKDAALREQKN